MRNLAILSLLFSLFIISSCRFAADVPLAVWSGEGYLTGQNIPVSNTLTPSDVEFMIDTFVSPSHSREGFLTQFVSQKSLPEVVVIFAEGKIRSNQVSTHKQSFVNLRNLLKSEKSSLFAPFVDLDVSFDNSIVNVAYNTKLNSGRVIYVGKGSILLHDLTRRVSPTLLNLEGLNAALSDSQIFSNGVADLIIVYLNSNSINIGTKLKESDTIISSVQKVVSSFTSSYVMAYIGLEYDEPQWNTKFASSSDPEAAVYNKRFILASNNISNASNGTNGTIPVFREYFGGWFWELFLVCLFLIPLLVVGVYGINGIQTPIFDAKMKKK